MKNLKDSELRYRRLFEAAQDGILILDAETGMIEDVNPYLIKMLGYSREEFIQKKLWEVGAFRDIEASQNAFEALLVNEYIRYEDLPLKTKGGQLVQVEFVSNVYLVDEEKVIQCNIRDITQRKQTEEALARSDKEFRNLVENALVGIFRTTIDGELLFVNDALAQMLGFESALEIMQLGVIQLYKNPTDRITILKIVQKEGRIKGYEIDLLTKTGEIRNALLSATIEKDVLTGMIINITERKQGEDKLSGAHEFLQSVQDALSAHIAILDHEGNIVQVNSAWRDFGAQYGLSQPNYCVGMNYLDVCDSVKDPHADESRLVANAIREVSGGGKEEILVEYPCHDANNQRWFVARITSFENNEKKWTVVSHENITQRKVAEERIQRQFAHLTALSAIDRVIAANFDLSLSLSEILTHVVIELGIDAADILILNPNSQTLEYGAERGFRAKTIRKTQIRLGESFAGRAALERQLVQIPNLKDESDRLPLTSLLKGEDFVCYFGVPLITKGQVKGVLEIFHRETLEPDAEWFDFLNALSGQAAIAIENATLFESLQRSNLELSLAYDATIEGWSRALDLRDKETEGHTQRVTEMTVKLARAFGLSETELVQVRWGALLHDIGKMGVPDDILHKPGPLTEKEWVTMRKHPFLAYEMLSPIRYLHLALDIPYCHHEKWDGTGYPRGLKGEQIPLVARIFAVVDVVDALTSNRPYRIAWTEKEVLEHIRASSGTHFDPQAVDVFMHMSK